MQDEDKELSLKEIADKLHSEGKNIEAIKYYKKAIKENKKDETAWGNLGAVYGLLGKKKNAIKCFDKAISINPNYYKAIHNKGILLMSMSRHKEAITAFLKVLSFEPKYVDVLNDLALCLASEKQLEDSLSILQRVVGMAPQKVMFHCNLGSVYGKLAMVEEAEKCYLNCLCLNPRYGEAYANLAALYLRQGRETESKRMLDMAVKNPTETAGYHAEIGFLLQEASKPLEAVKHMEIAESMDPNYPALSGWLYLAYRQIMDWRRLVELEEKIVKQNAEEPFLSIVRTENEKTNYEVAKNWSDEIKSKTKIINIYLPHTKESLPASGGKKIKVGFLSYDFRNHPVGQMVASSFSMYDREKFHITAFSYSQDDGHENRELTKKGVDEWVDLSEVGIDTVDMAREIYERKIDILIEMTGFTKGNRFGVMAFRPAPIQVEWLGFPASTGADYIDYVIADKTVIPEYSQKYFSEKPVYLPCYQINNKLVLPSGKKFTRKDFKLPENSFVFASFNQVYKIEPEVFSSWMTILKNVPNSVLWLWQQNLDFYGNLEREIIAHGVEPSRIILAPDMEKKDHLERLKFADLCLDTKTYGGHTTTTDSLWAGVPVVTIEGNHFASRVSASILKSVGLNNMVVKSLQAYEDLAIKLAHSPKELAKIRQKLTRENLGKTLFNTKGFVRNLEKAFTIMMDKYLKNKKPEVIDLTN